MDDTVLDACELANESVKCEAVSERKRSDKAEMWSAAMLEETNQNVRNLAFETLAKLEPASLATDAVIAILENAKGYYLREQAFKTLGKLETLGKLDPATLAQHAGAVVARLEDSDISLRITASKILAKLDPATLAQHADAVLAMLVHHLEPIRKTAMIVSRKLPRSVTRGIDFNTHRDPHRYNPLRLQRARILRRQLLGRLGWYRCRLRLRVERLLWYWHALPYRPSGQGHAREVEAWRRMMDEL